jgi:hypothetical protein
MCIYTWGVVRAREPYLVYKVSWFVACSTSWLKFDPVLMGSLSPNKCSTHHCYNVRTYVCTYMGYMCLLFENNIIIINVPYVRMYVCCRWRILDVDSGNWCINSWTIVLNYGTCVCMAISINEHVHVCITWHVHKRYWRKGWGVD